MDRVGPDEFSGFELADYEESIRSAVKDSFRGTGEDLMPYFSEKRNPGVKAKVLSAIPSVEPVSYTHLDVYKRQRILTCFPASAGSGRDSAGPEVLSA